MNIRFKKLHKKAITPTRARDGDAGYDICALDGTSISPGEFKAIPTGIAIELPDRVEVQVRPRSGLAAKYGVSVLNTPGTIDSGYRGDIGVILINHGTNPFEIESGMRIAQLVFNEYLSPSLEEVDELNASDRGENKYGSSGS